MISPNLFTGGARRVSMVKMNGCALLRFNGHSISVSSHQYARPSHGLDLFLSKSAEEFSFDNDWLLGQSALAKHLEDARTHAVNDGRFAILTLSIARARLLADKCPQLVQIYRWAEEFVHSLMEIPHSNLAKVARVVFVHHYPVMVLTASIATTTGMLAVFADAAMPVRHLATDLPCLLDLVLHHRHLSTRSSKRR